MKRSCEKCNAIYEDVKQRKQCPHPLLIDPLADDLIEKHRTILPPTMIEQRDAIRAVFIELCAQYQAIGQNLAVLSSLVSPYLSGQQELSPKIQVQVKEDGQIKNPT